MSYGPYAGNKFKVDEDISVGLASGDKIVGKFVEASGHTLIVKVTDGSKVYCNMDHVESMC